jgi:hypothetical protein
VRLPGAGVAGRRTPVGPAVAAAERGPADRPLAVTTAAGTYVCRDGVPAGLRAEVGVHEQIHREQFALGRRRTGTPAAPAALEREATDGARARLRGADFHPVLAASAGQALGYGVQDWLPDPVASASTEAAGLTRAGLDDPGQLVAVSVTQAQDGSTDSVVYESTVTGGSTGSGSVTSRTMVALTRNPDAWVTVAGPVVTVLDPELGLGPAYDEPAYPYVLSYSRVIDYRDRDGRQVTVEIDGRVWFSEATMAAQATSGPPSFEALLALHGDAGDFVARLTGGGPLGPYRIHDANQGLSLSAQSGFAAGQFFAMAGPDFADTGPATFLDPRTGAGDQFTAIHGALAAADNRALARIGPSAESGGLLQSVVDTIAGWLDTLADLLPGPPQWLVDAAAMVAGALSSMAEGLSALAQDLSALADELAAWWAQLPGWIRGIGKAVAYFVGGLLVVAAFAGLVVLAFKAFGVVVAFGAVMLVLGAIMLVYAYVSSLAHRVSEALAADDLWALLAVPNIALLDVVGVSGLIESFTDRSLLTGEILDQNEEQRWERGTSGLLQLVSTVLMVRGMGRPARGRPADVDWAGNRNEFRTVPEQRLGQLPEGHSWKRTENGDWTVLRAEGAPEAPIEVIVSSDGNGRVSHIVRSGERTLHHDTMTRPATDTHTTGPRLPPELRGTGADNPYREPGQPRPWDKGHRHDYADAYDTPDAYDLNNDPRNFSVQAAWWNQGVRNQLVQRIRSGGGGYREIEVIDPTAPPRYTVNTPLHAPKRIPDGFIFVETTPQGQAVRAWRIPNDNALNTRTLDVLPQYLIDLGAVPRGVIAPNGTVAPPGSRVVGLPISGRRGDEEEDD